MNTNFKRHNTGHSTTVIPSHVHDYYVHLLDQVGGKFQVYMPWQVQSKMSPSSFPSKAKIVIVGAGAIGGLLGVQLSLQGHEVTFVARGPHLAAMQQAKALKIIKPDGTAIESAPGSKFVNSIRECDGPQDLIVIGLKMHQIAAILEDLPSVLGPESLIITTQNGIPWWYFQQYNGPAEFRDHTVESVDPGGLLRSGVDATRILATVVYPAANISEPGVIQHVEGLRFPIGEPNGSSSERVQWVSSLLTGAGFKAPVLDDIRGELWLKLWGTVAVNPLSALTHATLDVLCGEGSPGRQVVMRMMSEVEAVAMKLGSKMRLPMERRVDGAARVGKHRTSMLQDVETGRQLEIETIIGSVVELARLCEQDIPSIETIHGTIRMLAHVMKDTKSKVCLIPLEN